MVGPVSSDSNLRPIKIELSPNPSSLEEKLVKLRLDTQDFNEKFWTKHNQDFLQKRSEHVQKILKLNYAKEGLQKSTISAGEMSEFYRSFLDSKWKDHIDYNLEWQRRNFTILFLAFKLKIQKFLN